MMIRIYSNSKKKKLTKKQLQEQQDFLLSINKIPLPSGGRFPAAASKKVQKAKPVFSYTPPRETVRAPSLPDTHKGALTKTGIMKDYHKLSSSDREIVADVASCTAPIHKSSYTYVTPGMNPASLGRKNEVL